MFGFVKTEEKTRLDDNDNLLEERKSKDKFFTMAFSVVAFLLLNLALYLSINS